jgi:hypothetical protein
MKAETILNGLERLDLTGDDAAAAARLGFLEWVFSQKGEATACDAARAVAALPVMPETDAGAAFVDYLRQACIPLARTRMRQGRARRLH